MKIPKEELISILSQFNPWWKADKIYDLPEWQRGAFKELTYWIENPPAHRAVLLSGARQVGKTTLILQAIQRLLDNGVPASNILYATFDHPICKLAGLDMVLQAWREVEPKADGPEYLFLDEAQFIKNIGTWVKHQVDFFKTKRVIFTGSATPLIQADQESGVGRWHTIALSTLSFYEYLRIKKITLPNIPDLSSFKEIINMPPHTLLSVKECGHFLVGHFHEYLLKGGFPQTALVESINQSQKLLREDIVDKVLKRDMTALFGVRRILELEQLFIYLCMHDGGMQDTLTISKELGIAKPTVQNFIDLLESTHLLHRLPPFGYGKEVLRGKSKLYLGDPAIAPAVLIKGKATLEDPDALGKCVETAVISQLFSHATSHHARFSYFRNAKEKEIDLIVEIGEKIIPIEVKYRSQAVKPRDVLGLIEFCRERISTEYAYVVTKEVDDIGILQDKIIRIPAPLFCYWLSKAEFFQQDLLQSDISLA